MYMKNSIYNCTYEQLVGISLIEKLKTSQKVELAKKKKIRDKEIEDMLDSSRCRLWEREIRWAEEESEYKRGHLFYLDVDYPISLNADSNSPFCIRWQGAKPTGCNDIFRKSESITIVGTRESDEEGRRAAFLLGVESALNNVVVYSGYATGIDQASHKGACTALGKTFAIMPCGLENFYAFRHRELRKKIFDAGGGFISQFALDEDPFKWNFHYRNRLLALISDSTVVVQAPFRSGALITVRDALDYGKDVYVHSAGIKDDLNKKGTNGLYKDGALVISSYKDVSHFSLGSYSYNKRIEEIPYSDIKKNMEKTSEKCEYYRFSDRWYKAVDV